MTELDFTRLSSVQAYHRMTRLVAPRPIALVSSRSAEGIGNVAPFSYFHSGGANPPSLVICPMNNRSGERKDTVRNIRATGEYVINLVTRGMAEKINQASWGYPPEVDEFDAVGFTRRPSRRVQAPGVAESPVSLEMKLFTIVEHGPGGLASSYNFGEIVYAHLREDILTDGLPDNRKIDHLARLGGDFYMDVAPERLREIRRPTGP
ncbi:MAG: flavin reductase family protein [Acidobacteria bacterium]|nr:flavin reductase family protein [Acidobacteriota bacterium]